MSLLNTLDGYQRHALALLRIVVGYTFLLHGSAKLLGIPHIEMFDNLTLFSLYGFAGVLELIGGLLIVLGLFTRVSAFLLSGEMAFAYFMSHASADTVLLPLLNRGESAVLFCFIFLYIFIAGAGSFALESKLKGELK